MLEVGLERFGEFGRNFGIAAVRSGQSVVLLEVGVQCFGAFGRQFGVAAIRSGQRSAWSILARLDQILGSLWYVFVRVQFC